MDDLSVWLHTSEDDLLEQLGRRAIAAQAAVGPVPLAAAADFRDLGHRVFKQWEKSAYDIACGHNPDDTRTRILLRDALHVSDLALATALTSALVALGLTSTLATIVAALIVKKFFAPAFGEFCRCWREGI
jgi:hypothetical protein